MIQIYLTSSLNSMLLEYVWDEFAMQTWHERHYRLLYDDFEYNRKVSREVFVYFIAADALREFACEKPVEVSRVSPFKMTVK